ncbi:MAG: hypothetical protein UT30_C0004G0013 [Candidatus Uhrbacteria bacterium GW2011_GWF2_39_13]|uniref:Uncharacterized protein n=1 Tax=Candidatus Uhrbacteria bacterium GW2011_GWF2_39_13 TaxID=1618995 RepID=A0A0G0Q2Q8_9BACT|nr:MAG: hypothetical protein UT30_C0004G0013 [Candidatus Uhrbacteria bacterium GW2011_GWF2_39_13]
MKKYRYKVIICGIFTLLELLIVIAVITILAALLLPALSKTKDKAYEIKCASNLKQLYLGFMSYTDDSNFYMPRAYNSLYGGAWVSVLKQHINNNAVFLCPKDDPSNNNNIATSYGYYNQWGKNTGEDTFKKLNLVASPTVILADAEVYITYGSGWGTSYPFRHSAGLNALWLEGNVSRMRGSSITVSKWDWYLWVTNSK